MTLKIPALAAAVASIGCLLLISGLGSAQVPAWPPPDRLLSPNQLDNLVAPVALYPDPLLSQVLVASTYPLEVVQAYQWLQMNPRLQGPVLTQAAQQQNWDASIQALVMFPDVLKRPHRGLPRLRGSPDGIRLERSRRARNPEIRPAHHQLGP